MPSKSTATQEIAPVEDAQPIRAMPYTIDNEYIRQYLKNPTAGKTAALRATGYKGVNPAGRAHDIHKRLQHRIDAELMNAMHDNIFIGVEGLRKLAMTAEAESVRAASCTKLIEYGFKYLPNSDQRNGRTRKQILEDIKQTQTRIDQAQVGTVT